MQPRGNFDDNKPLSKRERERLRRETRKERMRRADAAVARRRDERSGSPLRVLGALVVILALLAGITVAFVQVGTKGSGGSIEEATASADRPDERSSGAAETSASSSEPSPSADDISVAVVGDITLGSGDGLPPDNARDMFAAVSSVLRGADVTIGSLQGTLSTGGDGQCPGAAAAVCNPYQAPPENAAALQGAGFDVMNVATQHAYDYGHDGLQQTLGALDRYGVRSTGLRDKVTNLEVGGTRVAVIGFAPYDWSNNPRVLGKATALISETTNDSDIVIVVSGGAPISHAFAHEAVKAGADLVAGTGPDAIYSMERYAGRVVAYSLGNFAGYRSFSLDGNHSLSTILEVRLSPTGRLLGGRLHSVKLSGPGFPAPDPSNAVVKLVDQLSHNGSTAAFPMAADGRIIP